MALPRQSPFGERNSTVPPSSGCPSTRSTSLAKTQGCPARMRWRTPLFKTSRAGCVISPEAIGKIRAGRAERCCARQVLRTAVKLRQKNTAVRSTLEVLLVWPTDAGIKSTMQQVESWKYWLFVGILEISLLTAPARSQQQASPTAPPPGADAKSYVAYRRVCATGCRKIIWRTS